MKCNVTGIPSVYLVKIIKIFKIWLFLLYIIIHLEKKRCLQTKIEKQCQKIGKK